LHASWRRLTGGLARLGCRGFDNTLLGSLEFVLEVLDTAVVVH